MLYDIPAPLPPRRRLVRGRTCGLTPARRKPRGLAEGCARLQTGVELRSSRTVSSDDSAKEPKIPHYDIMSFYSILMFYNTLRTDTLPFHYIPIP